MKKKGLLCLAVMLIVTVIVLTSVVFASAEPVEAKVLNLSTPVTLQCDEGEAVFSFTPAESGSYLFRSYTDYEGRTDPHCNIFKGNQHIGGGDDEGENNQFFFKKYLEKDVEYTLVVGFYNDGGYINFVTEKAPDIASATLESPSQKTEFYRDSIVDEDDFYGIAIRYEYSDGTSGVWSFDNGLTFDGMEVTFDFDRMNTECVVVITCGGYCFEYNVVIVETDVESIEISSDSKHIYNYEKTKGYYDYMTTPSGDEKVYVYNLNEILKGTKITVNYKNGNMDAFTFEQWDGENGVRAYSEISSNNWQLGGQYKVTLNYKGVSDELTVEIIENPVESIEVVEESLRYPIEGADLVSKEMFDPHTGGWSVNYEYDIDQIYANAFLKVNYKDNTSDVFGFNENPLGNEVYVSSPEQFYSPWTPGGENLTTVSFMGFMVNQSIPLLPNPVKSIEILPDTVGTVKLYENGYFDSYYEDGEYVRYFRYMTDEALADMIIKVNYVDGNYETFGVDNVLNGYSFEITEMQGEGYGEWTIGGQNLVSVRFMGKTDEITLVMEDNGVSAITIVPSSVPTLIENINGEMDERYDEASDTIIPFFRYYVDVLYNELSVMVEYSDGSYDTFRLYELLDDMSFEFSHDQYRSPWVVGGNNTITIRYMGKTATVAVTVEEHPIESIEVVEGTTADRIENTYGWMETRETEDGYEQFFYYDVTSIFENAKIKINYKNGNEVVVDAFGNGEEEFYFEFSSNQYETPWKVGGNNIVNISFMGIDIDYNVELIPSPVERIEVVEGTVPKLYEGLSGCLEQIYDKETDDVTEVFIYYSEEIRENIRVNVYMKDGSSKTISFYESYNGMELNYFDSQYETPWTVGSDNTFELTFGGKTLTVYVEIVENPIDRIEVVEGTVERIIENTNGYIDFYYDEELGKPVEFFYYEAYHIVRNVEFKVYLKDGTDFTFTPEDYSVSSDQYESPWMIGGNNILYVYVDIPGITSVYVDVNVEIIENPVESIEIVKDTVGYVMENTDGYWNIRYDEEKETDVEFFYYYIDRVVEGIKIKVNFKDGTYDIIDFVDEMFGCRPDVEDRQYEKPWTVGGDNKLTVTFMGFEKEIDVEIKTSPVKSIEVIANSNLFLYENADGYLDWYYDDNDNRVYLFIYQPEKIISSIKFKVTFNDDTTKIIKYGEGIDGFYPLWGSYQWEEPWGVGKDNIIYFNFMGAEAEYSVNIIPTPIESIEIVEGSTVPLIENISGELVKFWDDKLESDVEFFYYSEDMIVDNIRIKINYKDGTSKIVGCYTSVDGYRVGYESDQFNSHWGIGKDNIMTFTYMDKSVEYNVEIVKPFVSGIIVDSLVSGDLIMGDLNNGYYYEGDYWLDPIIDNLKFTVNYENGTRDTFTADDINEDGYINGYPLFIYTEEAAVPGKNTVYIEYMGVVGEVEVNVIESPVESITVTSLPDKLDYTYNHNESDYAFAPIMDGIDFEIRYSNGTTEKFSEIVTGFMIDWYSDGPVYFYETEDSCFIITATADDKFIASYKGVECEIDCFEFTEGKAIDKIEMVDPGDNGMDMSVKVTYDDGASFVLETTAIIHLEVEPGIVWAGIAETEYGIVMYYYATQYGIGYVEILGESIEFTLEEPEYIEGDTDGDGKLSQKDAIYLLYSVMFEGDEDYILNQECDFNGDGSVDQKDAIYLLYHVMFGEAEYPLH